MPRRGWPHALPSRSPPRPRTALQKFKFTGQKRTAEGHDDEHNTASASKRPNTGISTPPRPPAPAPSPAGLPLELLGDAPLRAIIVGHNPSETAWRQGHYYANPSNHLWRILKDTGLAPPELISGATDDHLMPTVAGIGFTDVGSGHPGTDSSKFKAKDFAGWRAPFFARLGTHAARAAAEIGCTCGACGAPIVVAFSGKRQFAELFEGTSEGGKRGKKAAAVAEAAATEGGRFAASTEHRFEVRTQAMKPAVIPLGRQAVLPAGWPLPLDSTEVWVMTSTSGASALTRNARYAPWEALAERLRGEAWPRAATARCVQAAPVAGSEDTGVHNVDVG